jgi:hypothetical protein
MFAIGFGPSLTVCGARPTGFDFGGGVLPAGASLSRATAASRFDAAGVLRIDASDVPRFDHDPATGAPLGLLIEPARTNEATMSSTLDDGIWSKSDGASAAGDTSIAPDGTPSADTANDASGTSFSALSQSISPGALRSVSVFIAKDGIGRQTRFVVFRGNTQQNVSVKFDTATGEFSVIDAVNTAVRDCGAFWRLSFDCDCNAIIFFPAAGAGAAWDNSASATGSVVLWGFQAEQGTGVTSYIPAGASLAMRAADILTLDWGRLGVPDGALRVRYVFDDGSSEDGDADVVDGHAVVPTTLARPWIRRIERR